MPPKTAVLLIQLGTPDSPSVGDVARYLGEFLNDRRVIDIPWLFRRLLVNGIIVPFRSPKSAKIYRTLWDMSGGKSPLLTHSLKVKSLLAQRFSGEGVTIEMAMRYQKPSLTETLERLREAQYEKIILVPLFPQYASASTGSALEKALTTIGSWWVMPEIATVNQFYDHPAFIDAVVAQAAPYRLEEYDHILFSYHGLPERQVDKVYPGDDLCQDAACESELTERNHSCYKATCYATSRLLAQRLGLSSDRYTTTFQSRLSKKWIRPFTDEVITEKAEKGAKKLLVFSPAFVSDCLETLVEIGIEYQDHFAAKGGEKVQLVSSSNDHPRFIDCLEDLIRKRL